MAEPKTSPGKRKLTPVTDAEIDAVIAEALAAPPPDAALSLNLSSLHEMFNQQTRAVLESADLDEEQKQSILLAMSCPCCGGGATSLRIKLRPRAE